MNTGYLLSGFGLLLCGAFIDSSRSPILPILSHSFGVSYQQVSLFLVIGYFTSVASTWLLIPLCKRLGAKRAGLLACGITLAMGIFAQFVHTFPMALVLGILVACSCSSLGAMANVFVIKGCDLASRGRYFAVLHTMYGLGGQAAPFAAAWVLSHHFRWNSVFTVASLPTVLLGVAILFKVRGEGAAEIASERAAEIAGARLKSPEPPFRWGSLAGLTVFISASYVAGEVLASNWMVTYLVETHGFTVEQSAPYLAGYFWCIAITRALCFLVRSHKTEERLMWGSLVASLCCFSLGLAGFETGFALAGILGPFFPLMMARMSRAIPEQAESVSIRIMAGMQLTLAICNLSAGSLIDAIGAGKTYFLPAFFITMTIALTFVFLRVGPRSHRTGIHLKT